MEKLGIHTLNMVFVHSLIEKMEEAGVKSGVFDVVV